MDSSTAKERLRAFVTKQSCNFLLDCAFLGPDNDGT